MTEHWQVAVNAPLHDLFTYQASGDEPLVPGQAVRVPFGKKDREVAGLLVEKLSQAPAPSEFATKTIIGTDPERPPLTVKHMRWLKWLADYYVYPLGQIQQLVYPPLKKHSNRKSRKGAIVPELDPQPPFVLNEQQSEVVEAIEPGRGETYLLHGVTGSGKTEVYMEVAQRVLDRGESVIVLVPEISLTPQLIRRFAERFGDQIAVIHSHLTDREKTDQWWAAVDGKKKLLIGARSALFCPIPNLGLVVVDEEHETSFKQDEKLKYNARDAAVMRGLIESCPVILGSATPSLESWQNTLDGKYKLLSMKERVSARPLPEVHIINPREDKGEGLPHWLSLSLFNKLKDNYLAGNQSALFLNRRGVAPHVQCYDCGFTYMCPNCDISLTLHGKHHLVCHYCGYDDRLSESCPNCKEGEPKAYGLGTEAVEQDLLKWFPEARFLRADRDVIDNREALEEMVEKMEKREVDFLVGTQMIAKGLDFKHLTLVGVVHADIALNIPDFRASERSFQLCTQVSGRAGRHETAGQVVIQTYKVDHPSLQAAKTHDYEQFAASELPLRETFAYPPFGKITAIRMSGLREQEVIGEANQLVDYLKQMVQHFPQLEGVQVLGPTPAPLSRIKNRYRYHVLIKAKDHKVINFVATRAQNFIREQLKKSKFLIDVDPYLLT